MEFMPSSLTLQQPPSQRPLLGMTNIKRSFFVIKEMLFDGDGWCYVKPVSF